MLLNGRRVTKCVLTMENINLNKSKFIRSLFLMSSDIIIPSNSYVILVCGSQTCQEPVTLMNYNVQYRATLFSFTERANIGQRLCDESLESGRNHLCLGFLAWSNQWDHWWGMHISKLKKIVTNRSHCEWWFGRGFQKIAPRPVNILWSTENHDVVMVSDGI